MDLVPIKVKIGLRPNGHADHPDWYILPLARNTNPSSHMPHGWHYDKTSGHAEHTLDSPHGMQWGMLLVSRQLADQAKTQWPDLITELTELEAEVFYDNKVVAHVPDDKIDVQALQGLKVERDLLKDLGRTTVNVDNRIRKALDPDDASQPGKRANPMSTWKRHVAEKNIILHESVARKIL